MSEIATLRRVYHGSQFRAYVLRSAASLIDPFPPIDPFIGVDHAWMSGPTFPPHRHAGFSAVSYVFLDSETGIDNRDSLGTRNLIRPGGLHWAAACSGIEHEEDPAESGKTVHVLQIFIALPLALQDAPPFVLRLEPEAVPVVQLPGVKIRVPLGSFGQVRSPLQVPTDVALFDISMENGAEVSLVIPAQSSAFVMPIFGAVQINAERFELDRLQLPVYPASDVPRTLTLCAPEGFAKVVLFRGNPLRPNNRSEQGDNS